MTTKKDIVIAFDAYGTLLDTGSVAAKLTSTIGEEQGRIVAAAWRKYQLEYTWRLNSMNDYQPFSTVVRHALWQAVHEAGAGLSAAAERELMNKFDALDVFPEVPAGLQRLAVVAESGVMPVVFSNGTHSMIESSIAGSQQLALHKTIFKKLVVVDDVKRFKPAPEVYRHLAKTTGKENDFESIWLVSGNPFDIVGAKAVGMQTAWVDRPGDNWTDRLIEGDKGKPTIIGSGVDDVINQILKKCGL